MKTHAERWFLLGVEDNHRKHGDVIFQWLFLVPLKGGRWHIIPQLAVYTTYNLYTTYILASGGLYATYHLLREPETSIKNMEMILLLSDHGSMVD